MEKSIVKRIFEGVKERKDKIALIKDIGISEEMFSAIIDSLIDDGYLVKTYCDKKCSKCILGCYRRSNAKIYVLSKKALEFLGED
ncbi:MAG TPA: hypothetical protein ENI14_02265 [Thermoplasmatales archaeon]|nr:hypothetical protein [Thermoplasmatales archaeon]